jgi:hypothetical protein
LGDKSFPIYRRTRADGSVDIAGLFVDDFLLLSSSSSPTACADIVNELKEYYEIVKYLGPVSSFLGINVKQDHVSISMTMPNYITECLERFELPGIKPKSVPVLNASIEDDETLLDAVTASTYRSMVGAILFIANTARPDIAYAASYAARSMAKPTVAALVAIKRLWAYLAGSKNRGIVYHCRKDCIRDNKPHFMFFVDSDWASDLQARRSTTGQLFMFAGAPVYYSSKSKPS